MFSKFQDWCNKVPLTLLWVCIYCGSIFYLVILLKLTSANILGVSLQTFLNQKVFAHSVTYYKGLHKALENMKICLS
uniref:Uncharacterized protein n=1 Tax=Anguilla anguilla TaxID=7936 RepID=A0A0E9RGM2_ANGAN